MYQLLRRRLWAPIVAFLAVLGPAIITANVDNDAPGIATYSVAGAEFGYSVLWLLWPTLLLLIVVQEICARMGVATGKGLADLIRESFGMKITMLLMLALLITNFANTAAEFAGVAEASRLFGISPFFAVPVGAALIWLLVVRGSYASVERIFLVACLVYFAYPISGLLAKPDWRYVFKESVFPSGVHFTDAYVLIAVGIVGATIAPWMQFYLQASVVEKGTRVGSYRLARWDVIIGGIFAVIVVFFITIACAATLFQAGRPISTAGEAAAALRPLAGQYASLLFAVGLMNAALFAASILPLSTAYVVCEGIGWERGIGRSFKEAPQFYLLFTGLTGLGAAVVLLPGAPLLRILLISQVMNGLLLPAVLVLMLLLVSRRQLMGDLVNSRAYSFFCWCLCTLIIA
ncbi:MAG: Nramp family divalent metal transporter, partial [Armatimonadetes bacterium]|nr:Nramp family divalent metal transporter [Armatimonadota bacterium]